MKQRVKEMEAESEKLREMHAQMEREMNVSSGGATGSGDPANSAQSGASSEAIDARSVYVGNVDYGATPEELHSHFQSSGTINRITILCDKFTGHPKGFAYIEFAEESSVANSMALNDSLFRNRQLKVTPKRTNVPGFGYRGGRGGRGMPMRGGRGAFAGRGFRGSRSRRANFAPY